MLQDIQIDQWVMDLLVDPLNKDPLHYSKENQLVSSYGRKYPVVDGVMDLRINDIYITGDQKTWKLGQLYFEKWLSNTKLRIQDQDYKTEYNRDKTIYDKLDLRGYILDIGGTDGKLRAFVDSKSYVVCDPMMESVNVQRENEILFKTYPFFKQPFNFVCAYAEHLPFKSMSFDTVHMRSCIDHFLNPVLALSEAYRVLKLGGTSVIGMYVEGGKSGTQEKFKNYVRNFLSGIGIERFKDYHVWHPTYKQLVNLIELSGFEIVKEFWQQEFNDTVVYLQCKKLQQ